MIKFNWKILANLYFCISYDSIRYKAWFGIFLQKALRFNQTDKADFCWEAFLQKENDKNKSLWNPSLIQKVQIENNASHIKCSTLQAFFELERFKWANNNNNNNGTTSRQGTVQSPLVDLCYDHASLVSSPWANTMWKYINNIQQTWTLLRQDFTVPHFSLLLSSTNIKPLWRRSSLKNQNTIKSHKLII